MIFILEQQRYEDRTDLPKNKNSHHFVTAVFIMVYSSS
ncbi:hypothetical protein FCR2A7T_13780 [Flavobacterium cauense R2A-7]|nr:hypothetical protein FCR2A7T_13780 [Flavobacterium cauense R2A-7]